MSKSKWLGLFRILLSYSSYLLDSQKCPLTNSINHYVAAVIDMKCLIKIVKFIKVTKYFDVLDKDNFEQ